MAGPRSAQAFVHWLEVGAGARGLRLGVTLLALGALSAWVSWRQFHGATSEATLLQADVGRQLAKGAGFTTLVNYPQVAAFLAARGVPFDARQPYPELYHAPLYSIIIAAALRMGPAAWRDALTAKPPVPPDGAPGDYLLLALNLVLLAGAAVLVFVLGHRLFDRRAAWLAVFAFIFSVGIWQQVVAIAGAPLLMVLVLAGFLVWERVERAASIVDTKAAEGAPRSGRPAMMRLRLTLAALGAICGLMFLTEYSAGALILVVLGYIGWRFRGRQRGWGWLCAMLGFALVGGPWIARNLALTGRPVALATQNVALKAGDPTAEPAKQRNTYAAELPTINLNKLGNKTLTELQESVRSQIWAAGALWFTAFLVAGALYTFRLSTTNRLRWLAVIALAVLLLAQAALNSGDTDRPVAGWMAPLIIVFGAGFFFVLLGSNEVLRSWPRLSATVLLIAQGLPLLHDALEPRRLHFQYPPYFPGLFIGMRQELERRDRSARFGVMADVPAGVAWYSGQRVWSQPAKLRDFYAITLEQPLGELLLTPHTLDRPFFTELAAKPVELGALQPGLERFGEWGRIYAGLFTGALPPEFPLRAPQKLSENLYVLLNPALPPAGK